MSSSAIKNVAVVGATGNMGTVFCESLVKTGMHTITALIREGSKGSLCDGFIRREVNFESEESLISALSGQQFLVITLPVTAPEGTHSRIVHAAAKAGVTYIMPNSFSYDIRNEGMVKEDMYSAGSVALCKDIEETGAHYINMACGFWYQWSLALGENFFGIDIKNKKATFFDDGNAKLPTSTWNMCGQALAKLLSLPVSGAKPSLDQWNNQLLYIASFTSSSERYDGAIKAMMGGDQSGFMRAMYTRPFYSNGGGNYTATQGLQNDMLGLPKEDLDNCTKEAIEMVQRGWNPFA